MAKETGRDITLFLEKMNEVAVTEDLELVPDGRIIFAMDATASRGATWQMAQRIQADMFNALPEDSKMEVQLVYFRGVDECKASQWKCDADSLVMLMSKVRVGAGITQIERVFKHALNESKDKYINALIFVGDSFEEDIDDVMRLAHSLGREKIPIFMFHEGKEKDIEGIYREFSAISRGAYGRFEEGASHKLADMLKAVAIFAIGGMEALEELGHDGGEARLLIEQMKE